MMRRLVNYKGNAPRKRRGGVIFANSVVTGALISALAAFGSAAHYLAVHPTWATALFCAVALGCATLLAVVFRLNDHKRVTVAVEIVAIVVATYLADAALIWLDRPVLAGQQAAAAAEKTAVAQGVAFDTRSLRDVLADLRRRGIDAYPASSAQQFLGTNGIQTGTERLIPLTGIAQVLIVTCNEGGRWATFRSDAHGFNNPANLFSAPPTIQMALVGDSYTLGDCVNPGEDIAGQLRTLGRRALNLGVSGAGPLAQLGILTEFAKPVAPKIVLWMYFEAGWQDVLSIEEQAPIMMSYLREGFSQRLFARQKEIDSIWKRVFAEQHLHSQPSKQPDRFGALKDLATLNHLRALVARNIPDRTPPGAAVRPEGTAAQASPQAPDALSSGVYAAVLRTARDRVSAWGGTLYFVYLPYGMRYYSPAADTGAYWNRDKVLAVVRQLGIPIIDIHATLAVYPDPLSLFPFRKPLHYNSKGYNLIARAIAAALEKRAPVK